VNGYGIAQATYAPYLHINNATSFYFDSPTSVQRRVDAFVQANRGFDLSLQFGVVGYIIVMKRLLDHQ
jgi:hypothetical protein